MDTQTILTIIWGVVSLCIFTALMVSGRYKTTIRLWEFVIVALILSILWPAELCIAIVMLPFYPLYLMREKRNNKNKPVSTDDDDDDDELDPLRIAKEHPEWTDGTTEYEDD